MMIVCVVREEYGCTGTTLHGLAQLIENYRRCLPLPLFPPPRPVRSADFEPVTPSHTVAGSSPRFPAPVSSAPTSSAPSSPSSVVPSQRETKKNGWKWLVVETSFKFVANANFPTEI